MKTSLFLLFSLLLSIGGLAQTINISSIYTGDTTGVDQEHLHILEHRIDVSCAASVLGGTGTFRIGLGFENGDETLYSREFSTSETGTFDDGASLELSGGNVNICLGVFTGLHEFYLTLTPTSGGTDGTPVYSTFGQ